MADPFSNNPELDTDDPNYSPWRIPMALPRQGGRIPPLAPQPEPVGLAPKIGGTTEDQPSQQASLQQFGNTNPTPPRSVLGTDVAPGEQISDKQMPKAEKLAADPKAAANFLGQQDYHNQLSQYGSQRKMLDHMMPTDVTDLAFLPKLNAYRAERGALQEQEANFKKDHPWGSPESAHPGVMGKIGHVLGEIGNVAGEALAPGVAAAIPGSKLNLDAQAAQGAGQIKEAEGQQAAIQKAEAATTTAGAKDTDANVNRPRETSVKEGQLGVNDRLATTHENQLQNQLGEAVRAGDHEKAQQILDMLKQEKAAQKPTGLQDKQGTDGQGHPARAIFNPDPTAPNGGHYTHLDGSPFPDFNDAPNPTANPQLQVLTPGDTPGSAKLRVVKPGQSFDATNAINPSQLTNINKSTVAEKGAVAAIKGYQQDYQQNRQHLSPPDLESLKVLTSHAQGGIANQLFQDAGSGVLDALVGQPFTNYTQKLMQGTMTADQYAQLSPAGQKMLFGYTHAIVANFVNMKQKLGSIGRNPDQIQAEMANIPVPYIDTQAANEAFQRTFRDAQGTTFNPFNQGGGGDGSTPPPSNRRVIDLTK